MSEGKDVAIYECDVWFIVHRHRKLFLDRIGQPSTTPDVFKSREGALSVITNTVHAALRDDWSIRQERLTWSGEARP